MPFLSCMSPISRSPSKLKSHSRRSLEKERMETSPVFLYAPVHVISSDQEDAVPGGLAGIRERMAAMGHTSSGKDVFTDFQLEEPENITIFANVDRELSFSSTSSTATTSEISHVPAIRNVCRFKQTIEPKFGLDGK